MNLWSNYIHALVRCQGSVENENQCGVIKRRIMPFTINPLLQICGTFAYSFRGSGWQQAVVKPGLSCQDSIWNYRLALCPSLHREPGRENFATGNEIIHPQTLLRKICYPKMYIYVLDILTDTQKFALTFSSLPFTIIIKTAKYTSI